MLVLEEKANYPITFMCSLLHLARSSYYAWCRRVELSATAARRAELGRLVAELFAEFDSRYGCRRIAWVLNTERDTPCAVGTVASIMREQGLKAVQPRAYKRTTVPGEQPVAAPDLIAREFSAQAPGTRLVGDITYLRTGQGWLYLATVIDLCTRMVVGWSMAEHMRTSLVVEALQMARLHGYLQPGAIFHSDRGCQYTSGEFAEYCATNNILRSLGRTGSCYDNAAAESFFATLKNEMYYCHTFDTRARARFAVAEYIEVFYNRKRHHSTLGYRTPAQALTDHHKTATAA